MGVCGPLAWILTILQCAAIRQSAVELMQMGDVRGKMLYLIHGHLDQGASHNLSDPHEARTCKHCCREGGSGWVCPWGWHYPSRLSPRVLTQRDPPKIAPGCLTTTHSHGHGKVSENFPVNQDSGASDLVNLATFTVIQRQILKVL
jgi:hypothetical protein